MRITLTTIQMDTSIQCRAAVNQDTVVEYAERMTANDQFPPVELFGSNDKYWIGDGWHRTLAARASGQTTIDANVTIGSRQDALKHALGANALHGARRTNADKRRCITLAIAEFGALSNRAIAKLCGVNDTTVATVRHQVQDSRTSPVTGSDGKQYSTTHKAKLATTGQAILKRGTPKAKVAEAIASLLTTGHNIEQICQEIGRGEDSVRDTIARFNLAKPEGNKKSGPKIVANRVIQETVNAAVATSQGLRLINKEQITISKSEAGVLLEELRGAMRSLQSLATILKGIAHD